jgi:hypothetical protein
MRDVGELHITGTHELSSTSWEVLFCRVQVSLQCNFLRPVREVLFTTGPIRTCTDRRS